MSDDKKMNANPKIGVWLGLLVLQYNLFHEDWFHLSFFLSLLVSLILEHYTRECESSNFDKIKNKNNTKNKTTQKLLAEFLFK